MTTTSAEPLDPLPPAHTWRLARGGLSVDAGGTRIRCEAGIPVEERRAICQAIAAIPKMRDALIATLALYNGTADQCAILHEAAKDGETYADTVGRLADQALDEALG